MSSTSIELADHFLVGDLELPNTFANRGVWARHCFITHPHLSEVDADGLVWMPCSDGLWYSVAGNWSSMSPREKIRKQAARECENEAALCGCTAKCKTIQLNCNVEATLPGPQVVYRFSSASGELLYVGLTCNLLRRLTDHYNSKEWWPEVATIGVEYFPNREAAAAAESAAIWNENPLHNKRGKKPES